MFCNYPVCAYIVILLQMSTTMAFNLSGSNRTCADSACSRIVERKGEFYLNLVEMWRIMAKHTNLKSTRELLSQINS